MKGTEDLEKYRGEYTPGKTKNNTIKTENYSNIENR